MNKFLFLVIAAVVVAVAAPATIQANAQTSAAPPLELDKPVTPPPPAENGEEKAATPALGKISIQISQTEQIILDLPLKSDNKYQVAPIK